LTIFDEVHFNILLHFKQCTFFFSLNRL
jgi:hypothetical protein